MKQVRSDLTQHVGGSPSPTQRALIDQAARLALRIDQMDQNFMSRGEMSPDESKTYLLWCESYRQILCDLGMRSMPPRQQSLIEAAAGQHP